MCKKRLLQKFILLVSLLTVFSVVKRQVESSEKQKIFVLQVIEENWDNLDPSWYGKEKRGPPYSFKSEEEEQAHLAASFGFDKKYTGEEIVKKFQLDISTTTKYFLWHWIQFKGKGRKTADWYRYAFEQIPYTIPIVEPEGIHEHLRDFRAVNSDMDISSVTMNDSVKIKYGNTITECPAGERLVLSEKEKVVLSGEILTDWKHRGLKQEELRKLLGKDSFVGVDWYFKQNPDRKFSFKTKLSIINHGYVEVIK